MDFTWKYKGFIQIQFTGGNGTYYFKLQKKYISSITLKVFFVLLFSKLSKEIEYNENEYSDGMTTIELIKICLH